MRAFIIRPFGKKEGIDFDKVARVLIAPALEAVGAQGRETLDIVEAGNIRVDMFRRLLTADLVVADLSIHNANVFYELGIRHALRDRSTFMLRCDARKFPFDLQTDRDLIERVRKLGARYDIIDTKKEFGLGRAPAVKRPASQPEKPQARRRAPSKKRGSSPPRPRKSRG